MSADKLRDSAGAAYPRMELFYPFPLSSLPFSFLHPSLNYSCPLSSLAQRWKGESPGPPLSLISLLSLSGGLEFSSVQFWNLAVQNLADGSSENLCFLNLRFNLVYSAAICSPFLQRVSIACYSERCNAIANPSVCPSVCLSVRHTPALCQNDSSYDHGVFTVGAPHDSSFLVVNFSEKFQREHMERGRQMREG